jgi:hypothetical protein
MIHQDIYDLKAFSADHYARPPAASKFRIRDITEFCISQDDPFTVNCKYTYTSLEAPATFNIKKKGKAKSKVLGALKKK